MEVLLKQRINHYKPIITKDRLMGAYTQTLYNINI